MEREGTNNHPLDGSQLSTPLPLEQPKKESDTKKKIDLLNIINKNSTLFEHNQGKENESLWAELFYTHFQGENVAEFKSDDDCFYYVRRIEGESPKKEKDSVGVKDPFFVRRKDAKGLPAKGDPQIRWEETFFLNILLHHYDYQMEVSIRQRNSSETPPSGQKKKKLHILKKVEKTVYAIPNKIRMDQSKAEEVSCTYPIIYFAIDDFHEAWKDITLETNSQLVCVELFASGDFLTPGKVQRTRLFAGALDYEVMRKEYAAKKWVWSSPTSSHFFNLKGPGGRGAAQMMVAARADSPSSSSSPSSSPSSPSSWSSLGKAFRRFSVGSPEEYSLSCSLTSLNEHWEHLMLGLLQDCNKLNGS